MFAAILHIGGCSTFCKQGTRCGGETWGNSPRGKPGYRWKVKLCITTQVWPNRLMLLSRRIEMWTVCDYVKFV